MLHSTLIATLVLLGVSSTTQAAPFLSSSSKVDILKRAPSQSEQTSSSIDKHAHTNMTQVQIHESCDAGQTRFIESGLRDMNTLASHAYERLLKYGEDDPLYRKYFGNASSSSAIGFYAQLLYGNKPGVLFRCDDVDGNCNQVTAEGPWAGHYRGSNATQQTVICPATFNTSRRMQLDTLCWNGVEIGSLPPTQWLATDFMHRLIHIPSITYNHIDHAADTLGGVLQLAKENSSMTVWNQNTYQFYALDAYAYDIVWPGKSCVTSNPPQEEESSHSHSTSSDTSSPTTTMTMTTTPPAPLPTSTSTVVEEENHDGHDHDHDHEEEPAATETATAVESCHTHADGEVHCS